VDTSYASGDLTYIPLFDETGFWSVQLNSITVGTSSIVSTVGMAMLDTGTSMISGPEADFSSILDALNEVGSCNIGQSEGSVTCDCNAISSYPDITFQLGGSSFSLGPEDYMYQEGSSCILLIDGSTEEEWILGDSFLRKYYSVYDMEQRRVGLALAASSGQCLALVVALFLY